MKSAAWVLLFLVVALGIFFLSEVRGDDLKPEAAIATDTNAPAYQLATTNVISAPVADLRQRTWIIEGPLMEPVRSRPEVPSEKKFATGAKAFANLFNPFAPVPPNEPLVLATHYTFDPLGMNKSLPRAFRNEHTEEPIPLISVRRSMTLKKAPK